MDQSYSKAISRRRLNRVYRESRFEHHFKAISLIHMMELGGTRSQMGHSRSHQRLALKLEIFFKSNMIKGLLLDLERPSYLQPALR